MKRQLENQLKLSHAMHVTLPLKILVWERSEFFPFLMTKYDF